MLILEVCCVVALVRLVFDALTGRERRGPSLLGFVAGWIWGGR